MSDHATAHRTHCQDCGHALSGPFCSNCGQHDVDYHRSFLHVLEDSVEGLFHFDGKFLKSLRYVLSRPGYLTVEFLEGKRTRYSNPIRFFVFASFLFFFATTFTEPIAKVNDPAEAPKADGVTASYDATRPVPTPVPTPSVVILGGKTPAGATPRNLGTFKLEGGVFGWLERRADVAQKAYGKEYGKVLTEKIMHFMPTLVFFCLPVLALLLKLAYFRNARGLYMEHLIFALHTITLVYIVALIAIVLNLALFWAGPNVRGVIDLAAFAFAVYALFRSLRVVYREGRIRTGLKLVAVAALFGVVLTAGIAAISITSFALVSSEV